MKFEDRLQRMDGFRAAMIFLRVFEMRSVDMSVYLQNIVCWTFVGINVGWDTHLLPSERFSNILRG